MPASLLHLSPDTSVLLVTLGVLLVYVELNRPGLVLPGALGLLLILVPAAPLLREPLNPPGIVLIAVAVFVLARALRRPTPPWLFVAAFFFLAAGLKLLVTNPSAPQIHLRVAAPCALLLVLCTAILTRIARRARRNKGLD